MWVFFQLYPRNACGVFSRYFLFFPCYMKLLFGIWSIHHVLILIDYGHLLGFCAIISQSNGILILFLHKQLFSINTFFFFFLLPRLWIAEFVEILTQFYVLPSLNFLMKVVISFIDASIQNFLYSIYSLLCTCNITNLIFVLYHRWCKGSIKSWWDHARLLSCQSLTFKDCDLAC